MEHMSETLDALRPPSGSGEPAIQLQASRNRNAGQGLFPASPGTSPSAPRCEPLTLSDRAVLYSFTIIHPNLRTGQAPFALAYADFPEKTRAFGRLRMPEDGRLRIAGATAVEMDHSSSGKRNCCRARKSPLRESHKPLAERVCFTQDCSDDQTK